jgi:hypothetical protein
MERHIGKVRNSITICPRIYVSTLLCARVEEHYYSKRKRDILKQNGPEGRPRSFLAFDPDIHVTAA